MQPRHRAEFSEFASARAGALHRAAYLMVGDVQLAQDLVQEALTKTYMAWPRLHDTGKAEAYCRKAITTTAITWFRRRSFSHERPGPVPEAVTETARHGDPNVRMWLWSEIQSLPPRMRIALVLRYYEDLTEAQTAEVMGCAVGTVKSQVSAALTRLRERVSPDELMVL